ncbi:hypothetical protein MMC18_008974 [Xylographa bjoerkii]|nr:hypothetical protein [Xylographa bjoerkii]
MVGAGDIYNEHQDERDWLDQESNLPFPGHDPAVARLCQPCRTFFGEPIVADSNYFHFQFLASLRKSAGLGCRLCCLVLSKISTNTGPGPADELCLQYAVEGQSSTDGTSLEVWATYRTSPAELGASESEADWGGISISLVSESEIADLTLEHEILKTTASEANVKIANRWFTHCLETHKICNRDVDLDWAPTRLLEIDSLKVSPSVRIVEIAEHPDLRPSYMALSHCWGSSKIITLTAKTIRKLKEGISQSELPLTFRHAIAAANWLGKRYLWIDSLCILQDSADDWRTEANTMRYVYKNAWGTIAATGASTSSEGCFYDRDPDLVHPFKINVAEASDLCRPFYCFPSEVWIDGVGKAPLNKRAWVQQERLLSRRVLHFGSQQLFRECHELEACESFPQGLPSKDMKQDLWTSFKSLHVFQNTDGRLYPQWERIARAYSRGGLTIGTDKVVALAGIAKEMQNLYDDEYLAGMWRRYLGEFLVWQVEDGRQANGSPSIRSPVYRAPSWSWLSVDGIIDPGTAFGERVVIEILDVKVEMSESDVGQIKSGYIRLRGALRKASWIWEPYLTMSTHDLDDVNGRPRLQLVFDGRVLSQVYARLDDNTTTLPRTVVCLPVLPQRYRRRASQPSLEGLILVSTGDDDTEYQRVGYFRAEGEIACSKFYFQGLLPAGEDPQGIGTDIISII